MDSVDYGVAVRVAVVKKVGPTFIDFQFMDRVGEPTRRAPIPHPYAGRGTGIFAGVEEGALLLVAKGPYEKWYIVGVIPDHTFHFNTEGTKNIKYYENKYPQLEQGEFSIVGKKGHFIDVLNTGNIAIDNGVGSKIANLELSRLSDGIFIRTNQIYKYTEAGRSSEGVIKRNKNISETSQVTSTVNFFDGEDYDNLLTTIGRSSDSEVQKRTTKLLKQTVRNPPLIEKREIVYEYSDVFNVQNFETELRAISDIKQKNGTIDISALKKDITIRQNRRTDILNLNANNYNHLIEKVEGTLVDIYGNILDLNRNTIGIPSVDELNINISSDPVGLKYLYDYLRRSVKYHFEINSRKDIISSLPELNQNNNYQSLSRFSIDIDAEGLTKVNIPATSETGNIPILGRYSNNTDPNDINNGAYRDNDGIDVKNTQFGNLSGQTIQDDEYRPSVTNSQQATVGTAFHDIFAIAQSVFTNGTLKSTDPINNPNQTIPPINSSINNKILRADDPSFANNNPNAGGRSAHFNLDGSMELNIGADTVDRKSFVVDMAGGTISHYGRDVSGRSIIHQSDGDVIVQIGGNQITIDPRFPIGSLPNDSTTFRPGRMEIHLVQSLDDLIPPQKILINENGLTFDIQGSIIYKASNNIVLDAGGSVLINGEQIFEYSSDYDVITGDINSAEIRVRRNGRS